MRRRLFNLLAALSLLAGITVCVLWARSYIWCDAIEFRSTAPNQRWWLHASNRGIVMFRSRFLPREAYRWERVHAPDRDKDIVIISPQPAFTGWLAQPNVQWRLGGFAFISEDMGGPRYAPNYIDQGVKIRAISVPHWAIALLFLCLPLWRALRMLRRPRTQPGTCRQCGYDLQGLPRPRPRCPECGAENQLREESGEKSGADQALGIRH